MHSARMQNGKMNEIGLAFKVHSHFIVACSTAFLIGSMRKERESKRNKDKERKR
jgi:hypothetical protein